MGAGSVRFGRLKTNKPFVISLKQDFTMRNICGYEKSNNHVSKYFLYIYLYINSS